MAWKLLSYECRSGWWSVAPDADPFLQPPKQPDQRHRSDRHHHNCHDYDDSNDHEGPMTISQLVFQGLTTRGIAEGESMCSRSSYGTGNALPHMRGRKQFW